MQRGILKVSPSQLKALRDYLRSNQITINELENRALNKPNLNQTEIEIPINIETAESILDALPAPTNASPELTALRQKVLQFVSTKR